MTDHSVTLKYNPHHRTNIGPKKTPAVRVYRSDPEGAASSSRCSAARLPRGRSRLARPRPVTAAAGEHILLTRQSSRSPT
jgi:hypothetical protein